VQISLTTTKAPITMTMMIITVFLTVIAAVLAILVKNSQTGSGIFAPPEISGSRDVFPSAKVVNLTGASGPESIAFDPAGEGPYVGVSDGRILKWRGEPLGWSDFAHTSSNRYIFQRKFDTFRWSDSELVNCSVFQLWN